MKYQVKVLEVYATIIDVEAESEQDAQGVASELLAAGCYSDNRDFPEPVYDHTLERNEWPVWEA